MLQLDTLIDPDDLLFGVNLQWSWGINNLGQVTAKGNNHAYLLTPIQQSNDVPEPATLALFALGLAGLGFRSQPRKG